MTHTQTDNGGAALDAVLSAAAQSAAAFAATAPRERAAALVRIADRLDAAVAEIVRIGGAETALPEGRLRGELNRTTGQLRLFAEVVMEGAYFDARIDEADADYVVGPRPDVRRVNVPLGPVLVFAASNFPLAFSVAGGDTAAALAAGCPVVVKAHDGHPRLSDLTARIVTEALAESALPSGVFALISERDDATAALQDPRIRAASFTGSTTVGRMLADLAATRPDPIPFFGELGSVNPVFVTPAALAADGERIAKEYVASVTGSAGQLCTKPGFCFVPDIAPMRAGITAALKGLGETRLLTPSISTGYAQRRAALMSASGVEIVAEGGLRTDEDGFAWVVPTVLTVGLADLEKAGDAVLDETFGPLSVLVTYDERAALPAVAERIFPGNLTATLHLAADEDLGPWEALVAALGRTSGRVLFRGWPTGVSVTAAMQHGGPHPATTSDATSVGTAAIGRFLRAVCFQNAPAAFLPAALREDNPWGVPQRRSPAGLSHDWGTLTGRY
ncbi:MAG: aldehyde dehydrogenase (NADP(+)) [Nocardioides sp.]|nr:aldehyde dehydrogenase (NADP(+)) [Nocardioides sp.]